MVARKSSSGRGFTLLELLVVIGIIAALMTILLPALWKARRPAIVLASPIAYVGNDDALYLTSPSGGSSLRLAGGARIASVHATTHLQPPLWSPNGQKIAYLQAAGSESHIYVVEPSSGRISRVVDPNADPPFPMPSAEYRGWADSDHLISTGAIHWNPQSGPRHFSPSREWFTSSRVAVSWEFPATGGYVGWMEERDVKGMRMIIRLYGKNLSEGRIIWRGESSYWDQFPRIDPLGDYVAWTRLRAPSGSGHESLSRVIALKRVKDPSTQQPSILGLDFESAVFGDWASDSTLLINAKERGQWSLMIIDRNGRVMRRIPADPPPRANSLAAWRRYRHN